MQFERMLRRFCYYKLAHEFHIFKTWYKTASGGWTENPDEADWQRWHGLKDGAYCVETRTDSFWLINGVRYDEMPAALEAAEERILRPYLPMLLLDFCEAIV